MSDLVKNENTSIEYLNVILADTFVLYTKTLNCHWNVVGTLFYQLHKFFEEQYQALQEDIDTIAERIRALQAKAPATLQSFLALTTLEEIPNNLSDGDMVRALLKDREAVTKYVRDALEKIDENDRSTTNMLEDMLEKHEEQAWMLRSILEK